MAIYSELPTGQRLYLDNQGPQTIVTLASGAVGQQQQSSSSFATGVWTKEPQIEIIPQGAIIEIITETGPHRIQIQGSSIGFSSPHTSGVSQSSQSTTATAIEAMKRLATDSKNIIDLPELKIGETIEVPISSITDPIGLLNATGIAEILLQR